MTAIVETFIGLTLVTGRFVRLGLVVLTGALVGIMSPLVLFTDQLFPHGPSLMGQYVVKDIVLSRPAPWSWPPTPSGPVFAPRTTRTEPPSHGIFHAKPAERHTD